MQSVDTLKLNLGSRDRSIPGFQNMDIDAHPGVDFIGDVSDLSRFADGSVSEIYASHVLEHFPHPRTLEVLKEWHRVLAPGGILYVAVPDFKRVVELYLKDGLGKWMQEYISGGQEYATAYHHAIFDFTKLRWELKAAGFSEVSQVDQFPIGGSRDCSRGVSNMDGKSVSLNVVAIR